MRGKENSTAPYFPLDRITPAHAGKSRRVHLRMIFRGDHPRTCGEKEQTEETTSSSEGSPPHMRGKACYKVQ